MASNNREMDGIMLEFPLCCLNYPADNKKKTGMIISHCICERAKRVESNIEKRVKSLIEIGKKPHGFNHGSMQHCRILLAADELGIRLGNISKTSEDHIKLLTHISNYEMKYGNDAYCQIGKNLCFETRDGQFPYRQFAVLCAIQSVLGKTKKFKRITKNRIRYAMLGYKSKSSVNQANVNPVDLLTDRQLGTTIEILHAKKFFSKFTYANRQTFYSTRLEDSELYETVKKSKIYWQKKKLNLQDKQVTDEIKQELIKLKLIKFDGMLKTWTG